MDYRTKKLTAGALDYLEQLRRKEPNSANSVDLVNAGRILL